MNELQSFSVMVTNMQKFSSLRTLPFRLQISTTGASHQQSLIDCTLDSSRTVFFEDRDLCALLQ